MQTVLIIGADSLAGSALAAVLSGTYHVAGLADRAAPGLSLAGCELIPLTDNDGAGSREVFLAVRPDWAILCGPGGEPCWNQAPRVALDERAVAAARRWAQAARETGSDFACVSSDAVFTGPWLFHDESGRSLCPSRQAALLRAIEEAVLQAHPQALVARTHVFGWLPEALGNGWIERLLADLEAGTAGALDGVRHATPLLASDFAAILRDARQAGLTGVYHIGGAERTNPARFAHCLAREFGLPAPRPGSAARLVERPCGFGCGETSLETTRIRRALGVGLPLLAESLRRLREQQEDDSRNRLGSESGVLHGQAA